MRARVLSDVMRDSGVFDPAALARLLDEHGSGRFDHSMALWLLLVFEGFLTSELAGSAVSRTEEMAGA